MKTFYPVGSSYRNREVQCAFINRLLKQTKGSVKNRISNLTDEGRLCIAGDIPAHKRISWTTNWIDILWNEKWFITKNGDFSLENLIIEKLGQNNYTKPTFKIALNEGFDGYGSGYHKSTIELIDADPILNQLKKIGLLFDPDDKEPFKLLGPDIEGALNEGSKYGSAGFIRFTSEIYISPLWPVAELVELLVHEYGHVLNGEQNEQKIHWNSSKKILTRISDHVLMEAVSEALTEMLLQDVFEAHPETKVFHLAKLNLFSETRPNDAHLVGAAALNSVFFQGQQDFNGLLELARSNNFTEFLDSRNIQYSHPGEHIQSILNVKFLNNTLLNFN